MRSRHDRGAPQAFLAAFHNATHHQDRWSRADQVLKRLYRKFGLEFGAIFDYAPPYNCPNRRRSPGFYR